MAELKVEDFSEEGTLEDFRAKAAERLRRDKHRTVTATRSCTCWSEDEVASWVESVGVQLHERWSDVAGKLLDAAVDGATLLQMDQQDWEDCGIAVDAMEKINRELNNRKFRTSRMAYEYLRKWEIVMQSELSDARIGKSDPYARYWHKLFKNEFKKRQTEEEADDAPVPSNFWYQEQTLLPKLPAFLRDWVPRVMRPEKDVTFGLMICKIQNWSQIRSGFPTSMAMKGFSAMLANLDSVLQESYARAFEGTYFIGLNYFYLTWICHDQDSLKDFADHIIDWARGGLQYNRYMYIEHPVILNIGVSTTRQVAETNVFQNWVGAAERALVYSCTKSGTALSQADIEDDNRAKRKSAMLYRVLNRSASKREKIGVHMSNLIVSQSCDLSYQDPDTGETLLMLAARWGLNDTFDPTLGVDQYVTNPDLTDRNGNTILHLAVMNRRRPDGTRLTDDCIRQILVFAESNRDCKNKQGKTPIELADGDENLLQLLDEDLSVREDDLKIAEEDLLPKDLALAFGQAADESGADFTDDDYGGRLRFDPQDMEDVEPYEADVFDSILERDYSDMSSPQFVDDQLNSVLSMRSMPLENIDE